MTEPVTRPPMTGRLLEPSSLDSLAPLALAHVARTIAPAPSRMTMSPPPAEPPTMPPPRAVAMRAKRATSIPVPGNGPLRMTMSMDTLSRRWSS